MSVFFFNILAIVIMGFLVWRRGRDQRVGSIRTAHLLRIAGLVPLAAEVAILLLFGFGEMGSGDLQRRVTPVTGGCDRAACHPCLAASP